MKDLKIDREFQGLIVPLIKDEYEGLEASVKKDGKEIKINTVDALYNTEGISSTLVSIIEVGIVASSPEVDADFLSRPSLST